MKEQIMNEVLQRMLPYLDNAQSGKLQEVLEYTLGKYVEPGVSEDNEKGNDELIKKFIEAKRIEGCSEKTLTYYQKTIEDMLTATGKEVMHITTEDLRGYLTSYQTEKHLSKVTVDNVRRIHKVKTAATVKETYTDEALEVMRDSCGELRDLAMIDMLASTGMRVGEMVLLNRADINFAERECVVLGKGNKERVVYFDARTKIHLQNYLDSRTDDSDALFVTLRSPRTRLTIGGVQLNPSGYGDCVEGLPGRAQSTLFYRR